jgi:hypothetical protein
MLLRDNPPAAIHACAYSLIPVAHWTAPLTKAASFPLSQSIALTIELLPGESLVF